MARTERSVLGEESSAEKAFFPSRKDAQARPRAIFNRCTAWMHQGWHFLSLRSSPVLSFLGSKGQSGPPKKGMSFSLPIQGTIGHRMTETAEEPVALGRTRAFLHKLGSASWLPLPNVSYIRRAIHDPVLSRRSTMVIPRPYQGSPLAAHVDLSPFVDRLPLYAAPIIKISSPEDLVGRMFPALLTPPGARYVAACFWSWLCVLDGMPCAPLAI